MSGEARSVTSTSSLSLEHIAESARTVDPVFLHSPQFVSRALSERVGVRLLCKVELLNPIRSFKGRGADYFVQQLGAGRQPLVCASAGNFGQGLAYAAGRRGRGVTVFAAHGANPLKLDQMVRLGADVRLAGDDFDAAKDAARAHADHTGARFVEDGAEPAIAEGAGSLAVELAKWPEPMAAVYVPVGNGALITGVGRWLKAHSIRTEVIGVCAAGAPAMFESWCAGAPRSTERAATIADGIAVRVPVEQAVRDLPASVDRMVVVDDALFVEAMQLLFDALGVVVEPAGAAGLAGCLHERGRWRDQLVAVPLCGGNLGPAQVRQWLCG
ncbi:MAG: pyridoxal-phosphate dependent enzyme [Chloroflexi bacterium]|nr:pyridoxal-phosphate dependent enzyme [Chloroflexota bacterium]